MLQAFQKQSLVFVVLGGFATVLPAQNAHRELLRGDRAYRQNNYAEAEQYYRQAENKQSGVQSWYNLGNSLYQQEQYEEAAAHFRKAAEASTDPHMRARAWYNLGNAQFRQGDLPAAIEAYKNALRNNPQDADTRHNLALAQKEREGQRAEGREQRAESGEQKVEGGEEGERKDVSPDAGRQSREKPQDGSHSAATGNSPGQPANGSGSEGKPSGEPAAGNRQPMNNSEAEKLLQIMEREEQRVQQRMRRAASSPPKSAKDW